MFSFLKLCIAQEMLSASLEFELLSASLEFELLSASLVEAICQDSKVLRILKFSLSIILVFSKSIRSLIC
jgi:hypothetical protein